MPGHYRNGREWQREDHVFFSDSVRIPEVFFCNACIERLCYLYDLILTKRKYYWLPLSLDPEVQGVLELQLFR